eukprot:CCRYP_005599-RA/>CCRYP_005599-RA protein AED:0.32 eAED:0.32 QI:71/1/1/1/1/1/3/427/169
MVTSIHTPSTTKSASKTPAVDLKRQVSMSPTHKRLEDEVLFLRSQNKLLKSALGAVKDTATEKLSKSYELVWYARYRTRFPTHAASKWLDHSKEHKSDIEKLHSIDGDFHHGFNSGVLAASRMFRDHADLDVGSVQDATPVHTEKIEESKKSFPDLSVNEFPVVRGQSN